jgi:hypothetical protein
LSRHVRQLLAVITIVGHLVFDNELVLGISGDLHKESKQGASEEVIRLIGARRSTSLEKSMYYEEAKKR